MAIRAPDGANKSYGILEVHLTLSNKSLGFPSPPSCWWLGIYLSSDGNWESWLQVGKARGRRKRERDRGGGEEDREEGGQCWDEDEETEDEKAEDEEDNDEEDNDEEDNDEEDNDQGAKDEDHPEERCTE